MIENIKVFEQMIELNSKHVVKMLEYVVGKLSPAIGQGLTNPQYDFLLLQYVFIYIF